MIDFSLWSRNSKNAFMMQTCLKKASHLYSHMHKNTQSLCIMCKTFLMRKTIIRHCLVINSFTVQVDEANAALHHQRDLLSRALRKGMKGNWKKKIINTIIWIALELYRDHERKNKYTYEIQWTKIETKSAEGAEIHLPTQTDAHRCMHDRGNSCTWVLDILLLLLQSQAAKQGKRETGGTYKGGVDCVAWPEGV